MKDAYCLLRAGLARGIDNQENDVRFGQSLQRGAKHRALEQIADFEQTRRIQKNELVRARSEDARHSLPSGLRLGGHDGEVLPNEAVQKRRLPCVGAPHERDVACAGRRASSDLLGFWGQRASRGVGDEPGRNVEETETTRPAMLDGSFQM